MGKIRKATVTIVVLVLSIYFLAGLIGVLPYQYDYIKKAVVDNQEALSTQFQVEAEDWKPVTGYPDTEYTFKDSITYQGDMYVVSISSNTFRIWKYTPSGTWTEKKSGSLSIIVAITEAKFLQYYDEDGDEVLYLILSSADVYTPCTDIWGSYDGDVWQTHATNSKLLPDASIDYTTDCFANSGRYLYMGGHRKTPYGNVVSIYKWDSVWWTGWDEVYSDSFTVVTAMAVFPAPLPELYTTIYFALKGGDSLHTYAGIYYFDGSDTAKGAVGFQTKYETFITEMEVYQNSLFIGTSRCSIYNYSREPLRTTPPSGTLYSYANPADVLTAVTAFGIYNDYLYMGTTKAGNDGDIYKMTSRVYKDDSWVKAYETGQGVVESFNIFNSKFYATTGTFYGAIFVYNEIITYSNPTIQHTPVTEGFLNTPTKITARVSDIDGIDEVTLTYQVQGRPERTKSMSLVSGTGDYQNGGYVNGSYTTEIPEFSEPCNISYSISARDKDGNNTFTPTYIIQITRDKVPTFFGLDYRILYLIALALTLIIGYFAYGSDRKKDGWRRD